MIRDLAQIENQLDEINDNPGTDYSKLKSEIVEDLRWHIHNNDKRKFSAINIATDYRLESLIPDIATHLNNPDEIIREIAIANLIGRFKRLEYAAQGLYMAKHDQDDGVRLLACSNLGFVLAKIQDLQLRREIAQYLLNTLFDDKQEYLMRESAYESIIISLKYPPKYWFVYDMDFDKDIDKSIIDKFKQKYLTSAS